MSNDPIVETFQGFPIYDEQGEGFWWAYGGWYATVEECRQDIASYNVSAAANEDFPRYEPVDARDTALDPHGPWGAP